MSAAEVKDLREQRGQLYAQMQDVVKAAREEKRALSEEEKTKFDRLDQQQEQLRARIETEERMHELGADDAARRDMLERQDREAKRRDLPTSADARMAFTGWALGPEARTDEHEEAARKCGVSLRGSYDLRFLNQAPRTMAELSKTLTRATSDAQAVGDSTRGGNVVPNEPMASIERAMLAFGGMRGVSRVIRTQTGATLPIPTVNDTTNVAVIIGESTALGDNNVQFGQITLSAYKYTSRFVRASVEFMQDANFNFASWVGDILGERVARGTNNHFTVGSTAGTQPIGAITEALATSGQITYDNLVLLYHQLDPAYRNGAGWMFHDTVLRRIKRLVDTQGLPLWTAGIASGEPDMILGKPYTVNQDMATDGTASTAKLIAFGDFSKYLVRDVMDVQLRRLDERFADLGQVAFMTLSRHDGRTLIASTVNQPIVAMYPTT